MEGAGYVCAPGAAGDSAYGTPARELRQRVESWVHNGYVPTAEPHLEPPCTRWPYWARQLWVPRWAAAVIQAAIDTRADDAFAVALLRVAARNRAVQRALLKGARSHLLPVLGGLALFASEETAADLVAVATAYTPRARPGTRRRRAHS